MIFQPILKSYNNSSDYHKIDLSTQYLENLKIDIENQSDLKRYIQNQLQISKRKIAFGGYLEKRSLYNHKGLFQNQNKQRNIHLGIDFWADAGEEILNPFDAEVHSFADNQEFGNYGPCIILKHNENKKVFYSLYGHLSLQSLKGLKNGQYIKKNSVFCKLGSTDENGGYVPHLHFQIIKNISDYKGDYPGVCHTLDLEYYKANTMNPEVFLGL